MKLSAILAPLIAAKVQHEIIMQTVQAWESEQSDALEKRRTSDRERQAKRRSHVTSRDVTVTVCDTPLDKEIPPIPPKEINPPRSDPKGSSLTPRDELEKVLDAERAQAVIAHRQKLRKPLTAHAAKLLAGKFAKSSDPNAAADAMLANGWQGFEPEWLENRGARHATAPPSDRERMNAALDALISGEPHEPAQPYPPTIEASFERRDSRGFEGVVQFPAVSARY